jgi:AraC family transcriptional regulator
MTDRTSAEMLERHIRGLRLASSDGPAWRDALVQIFVRERIEDSIIVPAGR